MLIITAFLFDCLFGDPKRLPHPVKLIGALTDFFESIFFSREEAKIRGAMLCAGVLAVTGAAVYLLTFAAGLAGELVKNIVTIYLLYAALSFRSLKDESMEVASSLLYGDMAGARRALSMVVGRDTERLGVHGIVRATVETVAEGYIDGVVSPLFWMAAGSYFGQPALFAWIFKAASTMDSMIGYDNDKYHDFGFCAAKLDDVLNFIPARIGGLLAVLAGGFAGFDFAGGSSTFLRDRKKHKSPNSAHGEAAFAGLLGISLGGGAYYDGEFEERPVIGSGSRDPNIADIIDSHRILNTAATLCVLLAFAFEAWV